MPPKLAAKSAPVCDPAVTKALRSFHAVAPNPDRELADARACIDRGDEDGAIKRLDRARRGYLKQHDTVGLEHLLVLADVLQAADDRVRIGRNNLLYAIKQNLRQESRRQAQLRGEPWQDPYPDLQAPTEHTGIALTRSVKFWIGTGVGLTTLVIVALFVLSAIFSTTETEVTLRLVNNTQQPVEVTGCDDTDCFITWMHADLDPGLKTERLVPADDIVDLLKVKRGSEEQCLQVRVHDAYEMAGEQTSAAYVVKLGDATSCPGTTVLPQVARPQGL